MWSDSLPLGFISSVPHASQRFIFIHSCVSGLITLMVTDSPWSGLEHDEIYWHNWHFIYFKNISLDTSNCYINHSDFPFPIAEGALIPCLCSCKATEDAIQIWNWFSWPSLILSHFFCIAMEEVCFKYSWKSTRKKAIYHPCNFNLNSKLFLITSPY